MSRNRASVIFKILFAALFTSALLAIIILLLAPGFPMPREPLKGTPVDFGIPFENVSFNAPDQPIQLRGWWIPAEHARATILYVHGGRSNRSEPWSNGVEFLIRLNAPGFNVFAFDMRNHGMSGSSQNGQMTLGLDESNDVLAAINFSEGKAPGLRIFGVGTSMGGATLIHAAQKDRRLKAIAGLDPLLTNWKALTAQVHAFSGLPVTLSRLYVWSADRFFNYHVTSHDPLAIASSLQIPIMIIQNEADPICPVESARLLKNRNNRVELIVTPKPPLREGALDTPWFTHAHTYDLDRTGTINRLIDFFNRAL